MIDLNNISIGGYCQPNASNVNGVILQVDKVISYNISSSMNFVLLRDAFDKGIIKFPTPTGYIRVRDLIVSTYEFARLFDLTRKVIIDGVTIYKKVDHYEVVQPFEKDGITFNKGDVYQCHIPKDKRLKCDIFISQEGYQRVSLSLNNISKYFQKKEG